MAQLPVKKNTVVVVKNFEITKASDLQAMATVLKSHIVKHELYTNIQGKNYAHVEGWQFAGGMLGLFARITEVTSVSEKIPKYLVKAEIVNISTDKVIGTGYALCSKEESKKKSFDEYAVLSMAQTRAIGKAYRNILGWVMKLASFEGTPSEEMRNAGGVAQQAMTQEAPRQEGQKAPEHSCHGCGSPIEKNVHDFSKKMYKKPLCRDCQKTTKK